MALESKIMLFIGSVVFFFLIRVGRFTKKEKISTAVAGVGIFRGLVNSGDCRKSELNEGCSAKITYNSRKYPFEDDCMKEKDWDVFHHTLKRVVSEVAWNETLERMFSDEKSKAASKSVTDPFVCFACRQTIALTKVLVSFNPSDEAVSTAAERLCMFLPLPILPPPDVCRDYVRLVAPHVKYILSHTKYGDDEICRLLLPSRCKSGNERLGYSVQIPGKSSQIPGNSVSFESDEKRVLKVLQIADTHVDFQYVKDSWANCRAPFCCRDPPPPDDNSAKRAGAWGDWKCDIPEETLDNFLEFVTSNFNDIDHVIWTGDIPPHDLWLQTKETNLASIEKTIGKLKKYFPSRYSVLPCIGNHEPSPANLMPPPSAGVSQNENFSVDWLYHTLADRWTDEWLPQEVSPTIRKGGFYSVVYRPGLRLISINSVFCYTFNWWLIVNSTEPANELAWLVQTLTEAENKGEKVHIIAHVPPGSTECTDVWQTNYYNIIERFQSTVAAQFFGHTHNQEFALVLGRNDNSRTINSMMIGQSLTTHENHNPGFIIYYIDGDYSGTTREILDYESWIMDLEESNKVNSPIWKKLYSAKDAYQMQSLKPEEWRKVYERLKTDDDLLYLYHRNLWKDSPKRPSCLAASCRKEYLCNIVSCTQYGEPDEPSWWWPFSRSAPGMQDNTV